ncbi:hypothetical protein [Clostridium sp.]|uniref:hypothetical protein n=1 Tax=Clostridium sp. TaxID=1506 RepID=UPI0025896E2F|nr:hypothetical protein [Clostridium sp.]
MRQLTKEIIPSYWIDLDKIDTFSDTNTAIKDFFEQQQAYSLYAASSTSTTMLTGRS